MNTIPLKLLSTAEAAELLGLQVQTLRAWRMKGKGPSYIRYGGRQGRVFYSQGDVENWLAERTYDSTSHESIATARKGAKNGRK